MKPTPDTTCAVYRDFRVTIGCSPMVEIFPCWTRKQADAAMVENGWKTLSKWRKTFLKDAIVCTATRRHVKPSTYLKWNRDGGYTKRRQ